VIRELPPLIFIDGVADVGVGALHGDLAGLGSDGRGLRPELDVELSDGDCVNRRMWISRREMGMEWDGWKLRAHLDPILQFDLAAGVHGNVLESLACAIVRFATALEGL